MIFKPAFHKPFHLLTGKWNEEFDHWIKEIIPPSDSCNPPLFKRIKTDPSISWRNLFFFLKPRLGLPSFLFPTLKQHFFHNAIAEDRLPFLSEIHHLWFNILSTFDQVGLLFRLITNNETYITPNHLQILCKRILHTNHSLKFLKQNEQHGTIYSQTVTARIFFLLNTSRTGKISRREFRHSSFVRVFTSLTNDTILTDDSEPFFFSYQFVQAIRCKYYQFRILCQRFFKDEEEFEMEHMPIHYLLQYPTLNKQMQHRIMTSAPKAFSDGHVLGRSTRFTYHDFIYLFLAEKDMTTKASLSYWFDILDIDGNQRLDIPCISKTFYTSETLPTLLHQFIFDHNNHTLACNIKELLLPFILQRINEPCLHPHHPWTKEEILEKARESLTFRCEYKALLYLFTFPSYAENRYSKLLS